MAPSGNSMDEDIRKWPVTPNNRDLQGQGITHRPQWLQHDTSVMPGGLPSSSPQTQYNNRQALSSPWTPLVVEPVTPSRPTHLLPHPFTTPSPRTVPKLSRSFGLLSSLSSSVNVPGMPRQFLTYEGIKGLSDLDIPFHKPPNVIDHVLNKKFSTHPNFDYAQYREMKDKFPGWSYENQVGYMKYSGTGAGWLTDKFLEANKREQLRSQRAAARANRGQNEQDYMAGIPVRQWTKENSSVNLAPPRPAPGTTTKKDTIWKELPMPKGSELYAPHAQLLLRRARMPYIPPEDRDEPEGGDEDAEGEDEDTFDVLKWNQIPQGQERPEPKFLADRRKGLPSLYGGESSQQPPLRKAKVRRVDPDGTEHFFDVYVPEGTTVDGEVSEAVAPTVATEAVAPGTVVEGVGVANEQGVVVVAELPAPQPPRRKPPPPKRKKHGPGRGRRKKVVFEVVDGDGATITTEGLTPAATPKVEAEDGDEDEEGDDADKEEGELTDDEPTPTPDPVTPTPVSAEPPRSVPASTVPPTEIESGAETAYVREPDIKPIKVTEDVTMTDAVTTDAIANTSTDESAITPAADELEVEPSTVIEEAAESLRQTKAVGTSTPMPAIEASSENTNNTAPVSPKPSTAVADAEAKESAPLESTVAPTIGDVEMTDESNKATSNEAASAAETAPATEVAPETVETVALETEIEEATGTDMQAKLELELSGTAEAVAEPRAATEDKKDEGADDILNSLEQSLGSG